MDKLLYEKKHLENGCKYVAGVDEVGRGPLAGPVVCCAVIMPLDDVIEGVVKNFQKRRERALQNSSSKRLYVIALKKFGKTR